MNTFDKYMKSNVKVKKHYSTFHDFHIFVWFVSLLIHILKISKLILSKFFV